MEKAVLKEKLLELYSSHKGEIIGTVSGLIFALFVIFIGFWKTLFIGICMFIGYYIGKKFSNKEELFELLDRILPPGKI